MNLKMKTVIGSTVLLLVQASETYPKITQDSTTNFSLSDAILSEDPNLKWITPCPGSDLTKSGVFDTVTCTHTCADGAIHYYMNTEIFSD